MRNSWHILKRMDGRGWLAKMMVIWRNSNSVRKQEDKGSSNVFGNLMSTLHPCFYFRWLTRRHLHVSAKIATNSVKLVEPLSDSSKQPTKTGELDVPLPKKRGRKPKATGPESLSDSSKQLTKTGNLDVPLPKKRGRKPKATGPESLSDSSKQPTKTGNLDVLPKKRGRNKKATGPSLLVESKVKDFLDHVESIKDTFGLEDLERYRPDRQPVPTSPEFEEQYNGLRDTLTHAFNKQQLQAFLELYGLDLPKGYTKQAHVIMIMENAWSWPSLEKVKKDRLDWTVSSQRSSYLPSSSCSMQIIQSLQTSLWIPDGHFYSWAKVCHCLIRRGHFSWAIYRWH